MMLLAGLVTACPAPVFAETDGDLLDEIARALCVDPPEDRFSSDA